MQQHCKRESILNYNFVSIEYLIKRLYVCQNKLSKISAKKNNRPKKNDPKITKYDTLNLILIIFVRINFTHRFGRCVHKSYGGSLTVIRGRPII